MRKTWFLSLKLTVRTGKKIHAQDVYEKWKKLMLKKDLYQ